MSTQMPTCLTPEEYLAIERQAEDKSEYVDGVMYAMSGATFRHNIIVANVIAEIGQQLRGRPCRVLSSDMKIRGSDSRSFFYPDVSVVCGKPQFHDERRDVILNPTLVIKIMSESMAASYRFEKFQAYKQLDSLQEYILISEDEPVVEQFKRQTKEVWIYTTAVGLDASMNFPSIECTLSLKAIYDKTDL